MQTSCPQCHYALNLSSVSCPKCQCAQGLEALSGIDPQLRFKSQKLTIWFSLLLGSFGIHKFYLGQYLYGICYLIFCWTFIPTLLGWFDAFRTFKMSSFSFNRRYGNFY